MYIGVMWASVLAAALHEIDARAADEIDQAVLAGDTPRPHVRAEALERFGLANAP